jgi:hypothetical protein
MLSTVLLPVYDHFQSVPVNLNEQASLAAEVRALRSKRSRRRAAMPSQLSVQLSSQVSVLSGQMRLRQQSTLTGANSAASESNLGASRPSIVPALAN